MAVLALRLGHLQPLCFLYCTQSFMYLDTETSCVIALTACCVLHFFASLIHECIVFIMSLDSLPAGVNNVCAATISSPCNKRDSHSKFSIRARSATSASLAVIIVICMTIVLAVSFF